MSDQSNDKPQPSSESTNELEEPKESTSTLSRILGRFKQNTAGAASQAAKATKDGAARLSSKAQNLYEGSKLKSGVESLDSQLEERGVYKTARETSAVIGDRVREVTGKRLLELLEARLAKQDVYNDTLATRLAETMERVLKLEHDLEELKKRK